MGPKSTSLEAGFQRTCCWRLTWPKPVKVYFPHLQHLILEKKNQLNMPATWVPPHFSPPPPPPAQLLTRGEAQGSERGKAEAWCPPGRGHSEGRRFALTMMRKKIWIVYRLRDQANEYRVFQLRLKKYAENRLPKVLLNTQKLLRASN